MSWEGIPRYQNFPDPEIRRRILAAWKDYKMNGLVGDQMIEAIKLGFSKEELQELFPIPPELEKDRRNLKVKVRTLVTLQASLR